MDDRDIHQLQLSYLPVLLLRRFFPGGLFTVDSQQLIP